jgi:PIN domain nuclease of toxin-antitoxin system
VRLLLDTHVLLWTLDRPERLGERARDLLTDPASDIFVSIVSLWESHDRKVKLYPVELISPVR